MSRNWRMYLDDIRQSCRKVRRYTAGMSQDDLVADDRTYDAVVRNLEIVGEAAKHLPDDVRAQMPEIEWLKVAGMRDVLAHSYFGIDNDILWSVIVTNVPELCHAVEAFQAGDESRGEAPRGLGAGPSEP